MMGLLRRALARVPRAARICTVLALANGLAWSLLVPPFQVPDENAHYAYVQQLAQRGTLPRIRLPEGPLSPNEDNTLAALGFYEMVGITGNPAPLTDYQQRALTSVTREKLSSSPSGDALTATNNPPLYYMAQVVPYALAPGGTVLNRLALMRVLAAVIGALTVLCIFMFLRELLPGTPWVWTIGALCATLQPLFSFMSGGVNSDGAANLCAAALLLCIARGFRRGLTPQLAVGTGLVLAAGMLSKLSVVGFAPAVVLAVVLMAARSARERRRSGDSNGARMRPGGGSTVVLTPRLPSLVPRTVVRDVGLFVGVVLVPVVAYLVWDRVAGGRGNGLVPGGVGAVAGAGGRVFSTRQELSHIWQLFAPHLWMQPQFSYFPPWHTWFRGLFGTFGWLDYSYPVGVSIGAAVLVGALGLLAVGEGIVRRVALRRRLGELAVYVLFAVGLCAEIGVESYRSWLTFSQFEQPRYLLPLLGLYAAVIALGVRLLGRRWGLVAGVLVVVAMLGLDVYAQMLTVQRYYA